MREFKLTPYQVFALWEAMSGWHAVGATTDEEVQAPTSPQIRSLLDSFNTPAIQSYRLRYQLENESAAKPDLAKLKGFFQSCADAIPIEEVPHD